MKRKYASGASKYFLALTILILSVVLVNLIWLTRDKRAPIGNGLTDLLPALSFYLSLKDIHFSVYDLATMFTSLSTLKNFFISIGSYLRAYFFIYPPLVPVSYALTYFLFGINSQMELAVNSIYLALALFSIYGIGKKIFNEKTGLLAAFVFSSFPGIVSMSRRIYSEFILMCMIVISLFLLLKTDYFKNRRYSILLGVCLGLTALTKWEFPLTITAPFLIFLWRSFATTNPTERKVIIKNILLAIFIGLFISFFWYFVSFKDIVGRVFAKEKIWSEEIIYFSNLYLLKRLTFYFFAVMNVFLRLPYSLLLILSALILSHRLIRSKTALSIKNDSVFYALFLSSWVIVAYLLFSSFRVLAPSHIMSILPPLALIISAGIFAVKNKIIRFSIVLAVLVFGLCVHLSSFIDLPSFEPFKSLYYYKIVLERDGKLSLSTSVGFGPRDYWGVDSRFGTPKGDCKRIKEILDFIKADSRNINHKPVVFVLSIPEESQSFQFQYYNLAGDYQFFIEPPGNCRVPRAPPRSRFDYVIIDNLGIGPSLDTNILNELISANCFSEMGYHNLYEFPNIFFSDYSLVKEYLCPCSNTKMLIYKIIKS
jgi:hypothetical protein